VVAIVHISFNHTILNLTGYFIIAYSFRAEIKPSFESIALLISCAGTGLGIHFLSPHMQPYYGLSGAIYGLLSCYALVGFRRTPFLSGLFLAFLAGKIAYEQLVAPPQITEEFIGGIVAVDAHLYGGFTGLLIGAAWFLISTMKSR
jgi:rhomboid family GlyGly-CTERM serine protease